METFYLSHEIIIKNDKMYIKNADKERCISDKTWHFDLKDIGWEKICIQWIKN